MEYQEEDFLLLSGIQHFSFCRRQWALIHIEQQWAENLLTVEGDIVHEHCHDEGFIEKRKGLLVTRGLRVFSKALGVTGQCDVVEFLQSDDGCRLYGHRGLWRPHIVEYKHGKSKSIDADRLQLCCQAMCLEEMLGTVIESSALYYHETHRQEEVFFNNELREKVKTMLGEMHDCYRRRHTPRVKPKTGCQKCSLRNLCLPALCGKKSVDKYYTAYLEGDDL